MFAGVVNAVGLSTWNSKYSKASLHAVGISSMSRNGASSKVHWFDPTVT